MAHYFHLVWYIYKINRIIKMCLDESCNEVHIHHNLSDIFLSHNGLKEADALIITYYYLIIPAF
jgi:hypothetical protein